MSSPKYIADTPHNEDFFNIHSQIAETLKDIIKTEDVSAYSFTLGLLGDWGSGKSLTIKLLREELKNERDIIFLEFDVWKYIDTSLYRSILIDLENALKEKARQGKVDQKYLEGIKTTEGSNLYEVLYKSVQKSTPEVKTDKDWLSKKITDWETSGPKWQIISYFTLRPLNTFRVMFNYFKTRGELFYFLLLLAAIFSIAYYYKSNIISLLPFLNDAYLKPIFKFLLFTTLGLSAAELFKEAFKDLFTYLLPKDGSNVVITEPPTFAQDQFETIFKGVVKDICSSNSKKIVLVFDNIDRCEPDVATQVLSGLKTFLDEPKCFYLIPCDDGKIKKYFTLTGAESDFLDKIFQAYLRIPILTEENKVGFIEKCLKEANFNFKKTDKDKIAQILTLAYKGNTPRQIKRFFNDFVSYYKLAKHIDPREEFLLKDITHFTFMITIKQQWPEVEQILIKNPNALINFHSKQSYDKLPTSFQQYLSICIDWIDLDSNPATFIYLSEAKQSGKSIDKILLDNFDGFTINQPLINQFDDFLIRQTQQGRFIFLEIAIERLMHLTKKFLSEEDKAFGIELFKIYAKHVLLYDGMGFENKKQSYILSHHAFFGDHSENISKLDRNRITEFETHAIQIIRSTGFNDATSVLYKAFLKHFNQQSIQKLFENPKADELSKLSGFVQQIEPNKVRTFVSIKYLELLVGTITFTTGESAILNVFKPLVLSTELNSIRQTIATKLDQVLATFFNHPGNHPYDAYILEGLLTLNKSDFNPTNKNSTSTYIQNRITFLFQHGLQDQAIEYFIQYINLALVNSQAVIQNGHLNHPPNFVKFLEKVPPSILESSLEDSALKEQIFSIGKTANTLPLLCSRFSDEYLKTNTSKLYHNHINSLASLLDEVLKRKNRIQDEDLEKIELAIIDSYSQNNFELFSGNFETLIPKVLFINNKDRLIEKTFDYFNANPIQNHLQILKILSFIEDGMALNYSAKVIETLSLLLDDNFDLAKQVSVLNTFKKIDKQHFTKEQIKKINSTLTEVNFEEAGAVELLNEIKIKFGYNLTPANAFEFSLNKQEPGGDHAHNLLLNLDKYKYEFKIQPKEGMAKWRYGLKLSSSRSISTDRIQGGVPLFHLTKNSDSESLFVTLYDKSSVLVYPSPGDKLIKKTYSSEPIFCELRQNENGIQIIIKDKDQETLHSELLSDSTLKYGRLLAWADGDDFSISSYLKRIPIIKN